MAWYLTKVIVTSVLVLLVSEVSKRSSVVGAILASVPLVSVLGMMWLYIDTKDIEKIASLATNIFWLVLPSLSLFIVLPILLKQHISFYLSMGIGLAVMVAGYFAMVFALGKFGVRP